MSVPENPCPLTIEMSDPRLGATMIRVNIPRLVSRRIGGKTYYTWQPTKVVKALGFAQESFGTDEGLANAVQSPRPWPIPQTD